MLEVKISNKGIMGSHTIVFKCPSCHVVDEPRSIYPILCHKCGTVHKFNIDKLIRLKPERIRFYRGIETSGLFMG